ncbi:hypothetical protein CPA57_06225 [Bombella sp. TMW2.1880]|uniref:Uncharacterized protein n=1 Tax=Bombella favorum TaxID=2039164 RepID=A0ABR5ZNG0_9PROT|nr:hypothetical protein [Bombella favorum]
MLFLLYPLITVKVFHWCRVFKIYLRMLCYMGPVRTLYVESFLIAFYALYDMIGLYTGFVRT